MDKVELTFLGTGSAIPTAKRNHPAVLLQYRDENILIDCGEGIQRQFRIAKLNPVKITRILITHWHGDHVLGLPGLIQTLMLNGYNKTLKIYGPEGTKKMMELYIRLFAHKGRHIKIQIDEINSSSKHRYSSMQHQSSKRKYTFTQHDGKFVDEKDFFISAERMEHDAPCLAYSFNVKERNRIDKNKLNKLGIKGKIVGELAKGKTIMLNGKKVNPEKLIYKEAGRKIVFVMDTVYNPRIEKFAKNADILICEATYSSDKEDLAKEYMHLTTKQACLAGKKAEVKKLYLTHFSQRQGENSKKILEEARQIFKKAEVAEDFKKIVL